MLDRAVDEWVGTDVSTMSDEAIRVDFVATRRVIDRLESYAARLARAVHGRGIPAGDGASSTAAWVQFQTGQRFTEAKASLDAGRICESLPITAKAWEQGEISASAARTICRGQREGHEDVYAAVEETLVDFAAANDFRRVDAMIRHYQTRVDALDGKEPSDANHLHLSHVGNRWKLDADFDELAGSTVDAAIRAAVDAPSAEDARTPEKRRADAFTRVSRFFLDHAELPIEGGERPHIGLVVVEAAARRACDACDPLPSPVPARFLPMRSDVALTPSDISRLLCDAEITRIVTDANGIPLDVGRATYTPSRAMRRAVAYRDGGCRFPGCDRRPSWCEAHHVIAWPEGPTVLANLVLLCDFHHHVLHKPRWLATFDGITFAVTNPDGRVIGSTGRGRRSTLLDVPEVMDRVVDQVARK